MDALTEFAMSFNADGLDDSSHVLMTFVSQRSPGGSEPRNRQRSQDDSGNYGQVRHTHHESSKMNIIGKNQDLISNIHQVPWPSSWPNRMWMSKNLGKRQDTKTWNIFRLIKVEMFSSSNIEGAFQARDLRIEGSSGSGASPGFLIPFCQTFLAYWYVTSVFDISMFDSRFDISIFFIPFISKLILGSQKFKLPSVFGK